MEHDTLNPLLPDGVDPSESDALDTTWQMLGSIDAPAPDSDRMRARLDAVIDAVEHGHFDRGPERSAPLRGMLPSFMLQGLAAAAMLVIGIAIGRYGAPNKARPPQAGVAATGSVSEI